MTNRNIAVIVVDMTKKGYSSHAPFAKPPLRGSPLLCSSLSCPKDTMLIDWRSLRTFLQADFHAIQKIAHKNVRVNCNKKGVEEEE